MTTIERFRSILRFRTLSSALVFPALVLPTLVDLAFILRAADVAPVHTLASLAPALALMWLLGGLVVSPHIGGRLPAHRQPDSQRLVFPVVPLVVASIAAAVAWMFMAPIFDVVTGVAGISQDGHKYAQIRIAGLPMLAALLVFRRHFDSGESRVPLLWAVLVLNATNIGLNAAIFDDNLAGLAPSASGFATATVVAYAVAIAVAVAVAIKNDIEFSGVHWPSAESRDRGLLKGIRRTALRVASWSIPVLTVVGLLLLALAADQVALTDAIAWATTSAPDDTFAPTWTNSLAGGPHRLLVADWSAELARSRPPLYLAASTLVVSAASLVIALAVGVADAVTSERCDGERGEVSGISAARDTATALAVIISVPALAAFLAPQGLLAPLTSDSYLTATAAPALRVVFAWLPFAGIATVVIAFGDGTSRRRLLGFIALGSAASFSTAYLLSLVLEVGFMGIWWGFTLASAAWMTAMIIDYFRRLDSQDD